MKRDVAAVDVFLSLGGHDVHVGRLTREPRRGSEAVGFSYADAWLEHPDRYALQPGLVLAPATARSERPRLAYLTMYYYTRVLLR